MKQTFHVNPENPRWPDVMTHCGAMIRKRVEVGESVVVTIAPPSRDSDTNAAMWVALTDLAEQVGWKPARWRDNVMIEEGRYVLLAAEPMTKYGIVRRLTAEDFKDVLTAAYKRPRMFGGIDGGIVAVGMRTSTMSKRQVCDLIALAQAFGSALDVEWTEQVLPDEAVA